MKLLGKSVANIEYGIYIAWAVMNIFERIERNEYKWMWFVFTLIGSFLPMGFRYLASLGFNVSSFDIKDLLFAGLALNISNLTLAGSQRSDTRVVMAGVSFFMSLIIAVFIVIFMCNEEFPTKELIGLKYLSYPVVILSGIISWQANNYVHKFNRRILI